MVPGPDDERDQGADEPRPSPAEPRASGEHEGDGPEGRIGASDDRTGGSDSQPLGSEGPRRRPPGPTGAESRGVIHRFRHDQTGPFAVVREVLVSSLAVVLIGVVLFGISGVWPPMVAVESGSMQPHMYRGDLVFIMEEGRLAAPAAVEGTGVVTHAVATETGYWRFGDHGDVVVFRPYGRDVGSPIIHRAMFWVEAGENWYPRANEEFLRVESCAQLRNCPAPHAGFITKGDNNDSNPYYDQARGLSSPVKPDWIKGTARVRIPWLGHVRLFWAELAAHADAAWLLVFAGVRGLGQGGPLAG